MSPLHDLQAYINAIATCDLNNRTIEVPPDVYDFLYAAAREVQPKLPEEAPALRVRTNFGVIIFVSDLSVH